MTRTQSNHHSRASNLAIRGLLSLVAAFAGWALSDAAFAEDASPKKITYDEHVQPIFRQYCASCHSADSKKGDLAIDSYAATMEGGASGEVIYTDDLDNSRLWLLIIHEDEPKMPPEADKLPEDKLAIIRQWIEGGALENNGSKAKAKKKIGVAMMTPATIGKPEGPAAMPETIFREPIVYSSRAAAVTSLAASPWAPVFAIAGQRQVSLYHSETANLLGVIPFLEGTPQVVAFTRDGSRLMVAGGRGGAIGLVALYDVKTGSRLFTVGDEYDSVLAADINAQQTLVALGGPLKIVRVYNVADNSLAFEVRKHTDWITSLGFSPDGKLLITADRGGGVYVWEADTGREVATLRGHKGEVTSVAWRLDSQAFATAGVDGTVRLWNREDGKQIKSWTAHGGGATSVCFTPDGRLVTAGRDHVVKLWKGDGAHIKDLTKFGDIALSACVTHDGKRVAAGDFSGEVRLIDIESGKQVAPLPPNPPTLAMRVSSTASRLKASIAALDKATKAKQQTDSALVPVKAESGKRAATLADMQNKFAAAKAAQGKVAQDAKTKQQAAVVAGEQVKKSTAVLTTASASVTAAQAELSKAQAEKKETAAAEAKLTAATKQTKQAITGIETAQTALKVAMKTSKAADAALATANAVITETDKSVKGAQKAVTEYAPQLATAKQNITKSAGQLAKQQAVVKVATQTAISAKTEIESYAAAMKKFAAAIKAAEQKVAAEAKLHAAAAAAREKASGELATRQSAADAAAKKLAAAKAEFAKLKAAMDKAQAAKNQKAKAAGATELAQLRAEAVSAQATADKELFEKSQAVREEYSKK